MVVPRDPGLTVLGMLVNTRNKKAAPVLTGLKSYFFQGLKDQAKRLSHGTSADP